VATFSSSAERYLTPGASERSPNRLRARVEAKSDSYAEVLTVPLADRCWTRCVRSSFPVQGAPENRRQQRSRTFDGGLTRIEIRYRLRCA
jgi:hypothetical protein